MDAARYSTHSVYPCQIDCSETPGLCIFYATASLLVIVLAISLIWFPFVTLIADVNTIIARVVIYFNNKFLGNKHCAFFDSLETSVKSPKLVIGIALICMFYILYHASGDFLVSAACYFTTSDNKNSRSIKQLILEVITKLLNLRGKTEEETKPPPLLIEL